MTKGFDSVSVSSFVASARKEFRAPRSSRRRTSSRTGTGFCNPSNARIAYRTVNSDDFPMAVDDSGSACAIGFSADLESSRWTIDASLCMLSEMHCRAGLNADLLTSDGAGISAQIPLEFFAEVTGVDLKRGEFAVLSLHVGNKVDANAVKRIVNKIAAEFELPMLEDDYFWREVPVDETQVGPIGLASMPAFLQFVCGRPAEMTGNDFEKVQLLSFKKALVRAFRDAGLESSDPNESAYIASCSCRYVVYKGLIKADGIDGKGNGLGRFFSDLMSPLFLSRYAQIHARFATATFPSWNRAQPMHNMSHNGEITGIAGNANWANGLEPGMSLSETLEGFVPIVEPYGSDTAQFHNIVQVLNAGRSSSSLLHEVRALVPPAYYAQNDVPENVKAMHDFSRGQFLQAAGPMCLVFADETDEGGVIGVTADALGLRPLAIVLNKDGKVIGSSVAGAAKERPDILENFGLQAGQLGFEDDNILRRFRLEAGEIYAVDFATGQLQSTAEIDEMLAAQHPYEDWVTASQIPLGEILPQALTEMSGDLSPWGEHDLQRFAISFGLGLEEFTMGISPMLAGAPAKYSMGDTRATPGARFFQRRVFEYLRQRFQEVAGPSFDPNKERLYVRTLVLAGGYYETWRDQRPSYHQIEHSVLLFGDELAEIEKLAAGKFYRFDTTIPLDIKEGVEMHSHVQEICAQVVVAVRQGCRFVVLSDKNVGKERYAFSSLYILAKVHRHLCEAGVRNDVSLYVETGEVVNHHDLACLLGLGANGVSQWLTEKSILEAVWVLSKFPEHTTEAFPVALSRVAEKCDDTQPLVAKVASLWAENPNASVAEITNLIFKNYRRGMTDGLARILGKIGVPDVATYIGAFHFDALDLGPEIMADAFPGITSPFAGLGLDSLVGDYRVFHQRALQAQFDGSYTTIPFFDDHGTSSKGERKATTRVPVKLLHRLRDGSATMGDYWAYEANLRDEAPTNYFGFFGLKTGLTPVPLDEVESVESLMRLFGSGQMSHGALSGSAAIAIATAANEILALSGSGEGGESPKRFGTPSATRAKQVASGRFGVTVKYLQDACEIQIKIAQGAKPGEGGELPGKKVTPEIAENRLSIPGVGLISPPPHHDIYSIEDLWQLVFDLRQVNEKARISIKIVSQVGVGAIAAGCVKCGADDVTLSGSEGGTGSADLVSILNAGMPLLVGLAETHQTLVRDGLRGFCTLTVDGGLKTAWDVFLAMLFGADRVNLSTVYMISVGCVMRRVCHLNTCPVGVATQDPKYVAKFTGTPEQAVNVMTFIAQGLRHHMATSGFRTVKDMVGRAGYVLEQIERETLRPGYSKLIDLSRTLTDHNVPCAFERNPLGVVKTPFYDKIADEMVALASTSEGDVSYETHVFSRDNTFGTLVAMRLMDAGQLKDSRTVELYASGTAGQSAGDWLPLGFRLNIRGANDYIGKGLCGGTIVLRGGVSEKVLVAGNTCLYGATSGYCFVRGRATQRFAVRNSGASFVVHGVGDNGCEYMTGGRGIILGDIGINFGAGMTGGEGVLVWDPDRNARKNLSSSVRAVRVGEHAEAWSLDLLEMHVKFTGSETAAMIIADWENQKGNFVHVVPVEIFGRSDSDEPVGSVTDALARRSLS